MGRDCATDGAPGARCRDPGTCCGRAISACVRVVRDGCAGRTSCEAENFDEVAAGSREGVAWLCCRLSAT